jgi:hypothetical protein
MSYLSGVSKWMVLMWLGKQKKKKKKPMRSLKGGVY